MQSLSILKYQSLQLVLDYIKEELGYPYVIIELTDDEIVEKVILGSVMNTFSNYTPCFELLYYDDSHFIDSLGDNKIIDLMVLTTPDPDLITDPVDKANAVIVRDEEIDKKQRFISIQEVLDDTTVSIVYRFFNNSMLQLAYSGDEVMVKIKCRHKEDLSTIPSSQFEKFKTLALYHLAKKLLPIRKFNSTISTPLGDLTPDVDTVQTLADNYDEYINTKFDTARNINNNHHNQSVLFYDDNFI